MEVFSTKRQASIEETRALYEQKEAERKANKQLLEAQMLLEEQEAKAQEEAAKKEEEQKKEEKRKQALEAAMQRHNMETASKVLVEATTRLPREGREVLVKHILCGIMLESLWIDPQVTKSDDFLPQTIGLFEDVINKCDLATGTTLLENMDNTRLLSYINDVATESANEISHRILTEAKETKPLTIDFNPKEEEVSEIDKKIADADPKSISKAIKEKVLEVIKEEKENGKIKAELFQEIDEAQKEDEEENGDDVVESFIGLTLEATLEAINIGNDTQSDFRCLLTKIGTLLPLADRESVNGNTEKATGCYDEVSSYIKQLITMMPYQGEDDKAEATKMLADIFNSRMFSIRVGTGKAVRVEEASQISYGDANKLAHTVIGYCESMTRAINRKNIVTETPDQMKNRLTRDAMNRALMSSMGSTLFESQLIKNTCNVQSAVTESKTSMLDSEVQNAALLQTVIEYTMFETLNTLQVYHFNKEVISKIKGM